MAKFLLSGNRLVIFCLAVFSLCVVGQPLPEQPGLRDPFGSLSFEDPSAVPPAATEDRSQPAEPLGSVLDLSVQTVMLKFLQAENLEDIIVGMLSPFGKVSVDQQTNSVIICDLPKYLERIVSEIRRADRMPQQILIEVVIADVKLADDREIGVNWANLLGGAETYGIASGQIMLDTLTTTPAATRGMDLLFLNGDLLVSLHALQEQRDVELLATPRVVVVSGQQAEIKTVEEIPYTETSDTSAGGQLTSTVFKEVGVTLTVRATVTDEGKIQLVVSPKQSVRIGETTTSVPIVDTREARTTLLMNDGQVVVLGGLRRKDILLSTNKVPLLGNIPLLGALFSSEKKEILNSELIIMLSPHIDTGYEATDEERGRFDSMMNQPMLRISPKETNLSGAYGVFDFLGPPLPAGL